MKQLTRPDRPHVRCVNSDQSHRVPAAIDKLDLIASAALVGMHYGADIPTIKHLVRRIAIEYDERMLSDQDSSSGYAVTSRGGSSPSTIHTVNTLPERPMDRPILPFATYFIPNRGPLRARRQRRKRRGLASGLTVSRIACRKVGDETRKGIRLTNTIGNAIRRLWLWYPWQNVGDQRLAITGLSMPPDFLASPMHRLVRCWASLNVATCRGRPARARASRTQHQPGSNEDTDPGQRD
jgi:hypothetical protein